MWTKLCNLMAKIFYNLKGRDNNEVWLNLEARRGINLENLEALKKLRIKNF